MKLNADLKERVVVFTEDLPWRDSPMAGVQRRMLERDGEEVARATSIVRYAPSSYFSAHTHGGGEEFLVLDGIFSDEHGDYAPGTYVRNPVNSSHTPHSKDGCTILVKLRQMEPEDQQRVVISTTQAKWFPGEIAGLQLMPLHRYQTEQVAMIKLAAGTTLPSSENRGGEEIFVLEGVLKDEEGTYPKGTWLRNPPGYIHTLSSYENCLIYRKIGHLN
ncbi:MAG: cupin [Okeania sp. SIO3I5]|uniref:cupin domain-containing protein n=1 Tax=Okeania sp. SIO3I5 TaxID=2607805 RepID=UPI0013BACD06|nr:cupin domain-containing protein [Okeania sp. SIO3I5]NEQ37469.1 cupin [Okeania sp. SIO3I5]